jgi:hypothetical protein
MDIRRELLAEYSKAQTARIVEFVGSDKARFRELMEIFLSDHYRSTQRAAAVVNDIALRDPSLIKPYLPRMAALLTKKNGSVAVRRNVVRMFQFIELPEALEGEIYSYCLDLLDDPKESAAVRIFSMSVAARIAESEPPLLNELHLIVTKHLPQMTVAFHNRARRILN